MQQLSPQRGMNTQTNRQTDSIFIYILEFCSFRSQNYSKATAPGFSNSKATAPGSSNLNNLVSQRKVSPDLFFCLLFPHLSSYDLVTHFESLMLCGFFLGSFGVAKQPPQDSLIARQLPQDSQILP